MGYIYAMSNKSMPGILKIGMTERSIEERLKEANGTFTLIPFIVEMSKNFLTPTTEISWFESCSLCCSEASDRVCVISYGMLTVKKFSCDFSIAF